MIKFPKIEIFDGLYKHFLEAELKIFPFLDILFLKKEIIDGLYKHFPEVIILKISFFGYIISKKRKFLMAYVSIS